MGFIEKFGAAILEAQKIREESFDHKRADEMQKKKYKDFSACYGLTIEEATEKAVKQLGLDKRMVQPIFLLNVYCWGDIQDWAQNQKGGE